MSAQAELRLWLASETKEIDAKSALLELAKGVPRWPNARSPRGHSELSLNARCESCPSSCSAQKYCTGRARRRVKRQRGRARRASGWVPDPAVVLLKTRSRFGRPVTELAMDRHAACQRLLLRSLRLPDEVDEAAVVEPLLPRITRIFGHRMLAGGGSNAGHLFAVSLAEVIRHGRGGRFTCMVGGSRGGARLRFVRPIQVQ
jgi:hypothetical protein